MTAKCMAKGHKYQKFDDVSLFCARCGLRHVVVPSVTGTWTPTNHTTDTTPYPIKRT